MKYMMAIFFVFCNTFVVVDTTVQRHSLFMSVCFRKHISTIQARQPSDLFKMGIRVLFSQTLMLFYLSKVINAHRSTRYQNTKDYVRYHRKIF